ncbi:hypothetical protein AEAC466_19205 [Asticcacaulis sp. AC466]|nr:hypothetical protein AEAC466_19205 [Asticcacaulis sp. AC466]
MGLVRPILGGTVVFVMSAMLFGGVVLYPDAPIQKCDSDNDYFYKNHPDGYCGKQGQNHTEAEFRQFKVWETSMMVIWPLGILLGALLQRKRS